MNNIRISQRIFSLARCRELNFNIQRRFLRSESTQLNGLPDNAFNRERQAIKDHAAATSVLHTYGASYLSNHSATIPAILIASINAWVLWKEHWDHFAHLPPLEERTEYAYQNIRTKNFFWGDGDKTLFWNDDVNYHKKK
ncbi:Cytochrome c oxidase subunit 6A, mitochondrial [Golovinomyces cichoracearum]|uniref:Cytochrome c oxidase subunit n=1 Tax=Golovinomyces cichoracearum TaxID=62708 RepID=A0A420J9W6_9PEZI|nr:Cytochrome c oxidase subunit 6A, mitochondrial [Golovinomyces cichoracearum]